MLSHPSVSIASSSFCSHHQKSAHSTKTKLSHLFVSVHLPYHFAAVLLLVRSIHSLSIRMPLPSSACRRLKDQYHVSLVRFTPLTFLMLQFVFGHLAKVWNSSTTYLIPKPLATGIMSGLAYFTAWRLVAGSGGRHLLPRPITRVVDFPSSKLILDIQL